MEISSIGELKKLIADLDDDLPVMVLKSGIHITTSGKSISVAEPFEIVNSVSDGNALALFISQDRLAKEALEHPDDIVTNEELENL